MAQAAPDLITSILLAVTEAPPAAIDLPTASKRRFHPQNPRRSDATVARKHWWQSTQYLPTLWGGEGSVWMEEHDVPHIPSSLPFHVSIPCQWPGKSFASTLASDWAFDT